VSGLEDLLGGEAHQVSARDAVAHHDAVAQHLTPEQCEQAATDAVEKLTPKQREELRKQLTAGAKTHGHDVDAMLAPHGGKTSSPVAAMAAKKFL
jgi:hypothetical protein